MMYNMEYLELTEVKDELDKRGIKYKEVRIDEGVYVCVDKLIQLDNSTEYNSSMFRSDIRICHIKGVKNYHVIYCNSIYDNVTMEFYLRLVRKLLSY